MKKLEDNKKIISFSVDDIQIESLDDINDSQFALGRLHCFASGQTSHKYRFSEEVLKEAESTISKKPLLWNYSLWTDDASGHEKSEIPCGFVPELNADISYEKADDGRLFFCVNTYIWKLYSGKLIDILKRTDGYKHVSVELWILDSIEHPDEDYTEVTNFCYTGITILGEDVNPAVKDADIQIIKFSEAKESFENQLIINQRDKNKEVIMAKEVLESSAGTTPETMENAEQVKTINISVSEYTDTYDDDGNFVSSESEYHNKSITTVEEIPDVPECELNAEKEQLDNGCNKENIENSDECNTDNNSMTEEKCSELELKCSSLEGELESLKTKYSNLELKCSVLEEYKNNKENELKAHSIECALNDVVDILSSDEITTWREKSVTCSNVDQFKNELKAYAFDLQKQKGVKPIETLRNSISTVNVEVSMNVWDRLAKQTTTN